MDRTTFEFKGIPFCIQSFRGLAINIPPDNKNIDLDTMDYIDVLNALFPDIDWKYAQEDDYQGDWFAVGIRDGMYYFQQGDFGSCSGCDTLMGIQDVEEAIEFLTIMNSIIPIGKSREEAIAYLNDTKENVWDSAKITIDEIIEKLME